MAAENPQPQGIRLAELMTDAKAGAEAIMAQWQENKRKLEFEQTRRKIRRQFRECHESPGSEDADDVAQKLRDISYTKPH